MTTGTAPLVTAQAEGDPAGVGGVPESFIIPLVLIGISVSKGAHRPVERLPGAEIGADRDRVP